MWDCEVLELGYGLYAYTSHVIYAKRTSDIRTSDAHVKRLGKASIPYKHENAMKL